MQSQKIALSIRCGYSSIFRRIRIAAHICHKLAIHQPRLCYQYAISATFYLRAIDVPRLCYRYARSMLSICDNAIDVILCRPRCVPSILGAPPCASITQLICYQCPFHTLSICYDTLPLAINMLWAPGNYDQYLNNVLSIKLSLCLRYAVPPPPNV